MISLTAAHTSRAHDKDCESAVHSPANMDTRPRRVGSSLLPFWGQFVTLFVSARISDVSAMYQQCIRVGGAHVTDTLLIHINKYIPDTYLIQTYQERESAETLIHS